VGQRSAIDISALVRIPAVLMAGRTPPPMVLSELVSAAPLPRARHPTFRRHPPLCRLSGHSSLTSAVDDDSARAARSSPSAPRSASLFSAGSDLRPLSSKGGERRASGGGTGRADARAVRRALGRSLPSQREGLSHSYSPRLAQCCFQYPPQYGSVGLSAPPGDHTVRHSHVLPHPSSPKPSAQPASEVPICRRRLSESGKPVLLRR